MKKIVILISSCLLFSCGSDNNSAISSCVKNTSDNTNFTANSLQVFVETGELNQPLEGISVQLDHNGKCLITDEKGFVRFDRLSSDKHDIHAFGKPGFNWQSKYHIDTSSGEEVYFSINKFNDTSLPPNKNFSYVNISGAINNSTLDSRIRISHISDIKKTTPWNIADGVNSAETAYSLSYEYDMPEITSVNNELWFFEQTKNASGDIVLIDAVRISKFMTDTTKKNGLVITKDISFLAPQAKLQKSKILTFGNITYPVGFTFSSVSIGATIKSTDFPNRFHYTPLFSRHSSTFTPTTLTSTSLLEAYTTPFSIENLNVNINATMGEFNQSNWSYTTNKIIKGATGVNIIPKITNVPEIISNQKGNIISWSSTSVPLNWKVISIYQINSGPNVQWNIFLKDNSSQVTLPQLPNGVKPMLEEGTDYNVYLYSSYFYQSIINSPEYEIEDYSTFNTWTR